MEWIFWLVLVIILTIIEVATVNLLTIWFVASGIVALILSFFIHDTAIVSTVFALLGIFLLFISRPIVNKLKTKDDKSKTNLDRIIGAFGVVTEEIKKNTVGEVKVDGKKWSAISNAKLQVGDEIVVEKIDGVKLVVRKKEGE